MTAQWREPGYYFRGRPWFVHEAILYLESIIEPGWACFEWGSGSSTLWLAVDLQAKSIISMEHDREWYYKTSDCSELAGYSNYEMHLANLGGDYEGYILHYPDAHFDLVIVDGRNRAACIANAVAKVKPGGWLVLDNSEPGRPQYQAAIAAHLATWERRDFVSQGGGYAGWTTSVWRKPA